MAEMHMKICGDEDRTFRARPYAFKHQHHASRAPSRPNTSRNLVSTPGDRAAFTRPAGLGFEAACSQRAKLTSPEAESYRRNLAWIRIYLTTRRTVSHDMPSSYHV